MVAGSSGVETNWHTVPRWAPGGLRECAASCSGQGPRSAAAGASVPRVALCCLSAWSPFLRQPAAVPVGEGEPRIAAHLEKGAWRRPLREALVKFGVGGGGVPAERSVRLPGSAHRHFPQGPVLHLLFAIFLRHSFRAQLLNRPLVKRACAHHCMRSHVR